MPNWDIEEVSQFGSFCACAARRPYGTMLCRAGTAISAGGRRTDFVTGRYSVIPISYLQFAVSYIFAVRHPVLLLPMQ